MRVIYVAGSYTGDSHNAVFENIMAARTAARRLWFEGWAVICPHTNSMFMDGQNTSRVFIEGDIEILKRCDAIYMLKGWELSAGAYAEFWCAKDNDLDVYCE